MPLMFLSQGQVPCITALLTVQAFLSQGAMCPEVEKVKVGGLQSHLLIVLSSELRSGLFLALRGTESDFSQWGKESLASPLFPLRTFHHLQNEAQALQVGIGRPLCCDPTFFSSHISWPPLLLSVPPINPGTSSLPTAFPFSSLKSSTNY